MVNLWMGRFDDASHVADDALERAEQIGSPISLIDAQSCQAWVAAYRGREDEARRAVDAAITSARDNKICFKTAAITAISVFLEVSLQNYEAALGTLEPLLAAFDPAHDTEIMVGAWLPDAVEALTAAGQLDEAEALVSALETNGARLNRAWMLAVGARARALLFSATQPTPPAGYASTAPASSGPQPRFHATCPANVEEPAYVPAPSCISDSTSTPANAPYLASSHHWIE